MRGDQRGRGTQLEYDRKGKYSLSLERQFLPRPPYSVSGRLSIYDTLRYAMFECVRIWQYDNACVYPWHRAREVRAILASFHFSFISVTPILYLRIRNSHENHVNLSGSQEVHQINYEC